jgi:hypothetical protein
VCRDAAAAAREHGEHGMRVAVGIGKRAGLDGLEDIAALGVGAAGAEGFEGGVGQRALGSEKRPFASNLQHDIRTPSPSYTIA